MNSTKRRSDWSTNHTEGSHRKKQRRAEHTAQNNIPTAPEKHPLKQRNFVSGPTLISQTQERVWNSPAIRREISGAESNRRGHGHLNSRNAASGHNKALNYSDPRNHPSSDASSSTRSTKCNGTRANLPPLPPLPDSIARVVFTHKGALPGGNITKVGFSYDRLEFLGDAYIELFATRLVFPRFPRLPVGRLSQQREMLVKNETLAEYSVAYGFDQRVQLSHKYKDKGFSKAKLRTKLLGDVFEAYVAAIIVSDPQNGFQVAETWLQSLWETKLAAQKPIETQVMDPDAKASLSRMVMGRGIKVEYREEMEPTLKNEEGKAWFHMGVFLTGWGFDDVRLGGAMGLSKQEAGQNAAADALKRELTAQIAGIKRDREQKAQEMRDGEMTAVVGAPVHTFEGAGNAEPPSNEGLIHKSVDDSGSSSKKGDMQPS
ncbi:MAG: hypothetical protein Q9163_003218 [Psora crenata]